MNANLSSKLGNIQTVTIKTPNKILSIFLLVAEAVTVTIPVIILGAKFDFPDILRQPASKAFELFQANQSSIVFGYYVFLVSSLIYIQTTCRQIWTRHSWRSCLSCRSSPHS